MQLTSTERRVTGPAATGQTLCTVTSSEVIAWVTAVGGSACEESALRCVHMATAWRLKVPTVHSYNVKINLVSIH